MRKLLSILFILACMPLVGCGDDFAGSCVTVGVCIDFQGDAAEAQRACDIYLGNYDDNAVCPSDDRIGGCRGGDDSLEETWWFYVGGGQTNEEGVRAVCDSLGYEFVAG